MIVNYKVNTLPKVKYQQNPISFGKISIEKDIPITDTDRAFLNRIKSARTMDETMPLIMSSTANFLVTDEEGKNILHHLVDMNHYSSVKYIIANPDVSRELINAPDIYGRTPLEYAKEEKMATTLMGNGAKISPSLMEAMQAVSKQMQQPQQPELQDAKITSAQMQVEQNPEVTPSKFFNAFEEVEEAPAQTPVEATEQTVSEAAEQIVEPETVQAEQAEASSDSNTILEPQENVGAVKAKDEPVDLNATEKDQGKIKTIPELSQFKRLDRNPGDPSSLDDVMGLNEAKDILNKAILVHTRNPQNFDKLSDNKTNLPNGVLLFGPSGNGKRHLIKAVAAESNMPVYEAQDIGTLEKLMVSLKKNYEKNGQRAFVLINNIDNIVGLRGQQYIGDGDKKAILRKILNQPARNGITILATAECKEKIDPDLLAPEYLDRHIPIPIPDKITREAIIASHIVGKEILADVLKDGAVPKIADSTAGFSVAQIKYIIDETVRTSVAKGETTITLENLIDSIKTYSKEQGIPEINENNKTSMYDTNFKREYYTKNDPLSFNDVGGMYDVKAKIHEKMIKPWQNKEALEAQGIKMPDGVILYGPPGNGKTYIMKAVASELKLPLYVVKMSDIGSSYVHETSNKIKQLFEQLERKYRETGEASVLFLDELDGIAGSKGGAAEHKKEEINTLLQYFNNAGDRGIILAGATNNLEDIEGAISRDGRIGEHIYVGNPDTDSRLDIIKKTLKNRPMAQEVLNNPELLDKFAKEFDDMSAASISKTVNEALTQAIIDKKPLDEAIGDALEVYQEKELEKLLSGKAKCNNRKMTLDKKSTIKFDTKYSRTYLSENEPSSFDGLGGMDDIKKQLKDHIVNIWKPETIQRFKENNVPIPGGVILYGPSGNGKTTIAKALAGEMNLPFYEMSSGNVGGGIIHQTANNMKDMFEQLSYKYHKTGEASILFIDEIEGLCPDRNEFGVHEHKKEEITELLQLMNSATENGIILVGATNHLNLVDSAVKGNTRRMGKHVFVGLPDVKSRRGIIEKSLSGKPITKDLYEQKDKIDELANMFEGLTVGQVSEVLNTSLVKALTDGKEFTMDFVKENYCAVTGKKSFEVFKEQPVEK